MPRLFEVNTLLWLGELAHVYGKPLNLGKIPSREWDRFKKLGFDYVWLMGVWRRSPMGRRIARTALELHPSYTAALPDWTLDDVAGSPYSIQAYEPDPLLGGWEGLEKAHRELNRRGVGLILDLVCNHTGIDFPWVRTAPERYVLGTREDYEAQPSHFVALTRGKLALYFAKGKDPYFPPWNDTLQLDAFHPGARQGWKRLVARIAEHCEGLRCDMAMLLLNQIFKQTWEKLRHASPPSTEFWSELTGAFPRLVWIGEAYWDTEWTLQQLGFDFVYDKRLYDRLRYDLAASIRSHLRADFAYQSKLLRFIENHDEERALAAFGPSRLQAALVLMATLPGMRMYHHGQLEGRRRRVPPQLSRSAPEEIQEEVKLFSERVLRISRHQVFQSGRWELIEPENAGDGTYDNFIAYVWRQPPEYDGEMTGGPSTRPFKLIVVNYSDRWGQARIRILPPAGKRTCVLADELNSRRYVRDSGELRRPGLHVILEGYGAHVFDVR